ncbi:MAG: hypothetical protein P8M16_00110 [Acidimicrobiales bacterium]|nr:hypothetical protein [Acidimicrobiales bacterium]
MHEYHRNRDADTQPIGTTPNLKKQYTTFVEEREIAVHRSVAFDALCSLIDESTGGPLIDGASGPHSLGARFPFVSSGMNLTEEIISFEPPWRRVYELSGAPVNLYQATTVFTDLGTSCIMAWAVLIDPLPSGASDAFIASAQSFLSHIADKLKIRAEDI